jgi:putative DNA methylase
VSQRHRKKLIEVALPLEAINAEGKRDKSLNRGHPKALHWWWARRPLAVCRAVIFAQLVDDPSSHPDLFPTEESQEVERQRLFDLMRELVKWNRSGDVALMSQAFDEIARCFDGKPPTVIDPFCGGGSIPLEARRLGLTTIGEDINPVAVVVTKAMVEIPALFEKHPQVSPESSATLNDSRDSAGIVGLAADVAYYGARLSERVRENIGPLYADGPGVLKPGETPVAWIWARTVRCPNPACGGAIPLVNSFWLSRSSGARGAIWARPSPSPQGAWVQFEIAMGGEPPDGTVARSSVRCLLCGGSTSVDYVKDEGAAGRMGRQLVAVAVQQGKKRRYLGGDTEPTLVETPLPDGPFIPDESLPSRALGFRVQPYGFRSWKQFYTERQLGLLSGLTEAIPSMRTEMVADGASPAYADAIATYLAFFITRVANRNSSFSFWNPTGEKVEAATATNYMPMRWAFAEANPFADGSGGMPGQLRFLVDAILSLPSGPAGHALQRDATRAPFETGAAFCTDPPYFDNVPFADLSDFYYVWLKRALGSAYPDLFSTILTPKSAELVADSERHGSREAATGFFREGFRKAFDAMIDASHTDVPIVVYYALRQQESDDDGGLASTGWDAMLQSLVDAGLTVTATWPVRTEKGGGLRSHGRNALASSVVIACRPVSSEASVTSLRDLITSLRAELPGALRRLQHENIPAVDLAQAAIGPGMAIFSRHSKVLEADGSPMTVRRALGLINQTLDEILAEQEGDFDPDTRFAVAWFEQYGTQEGEFGVAESLSKAKNIGINGLVEAGILHTRPGKVRLLGRTELATDWDPATDRRLTVWEVTQHLVDRLDSGGESAAADLLRRVGGLGETARELAYRLYIICERKGWAQEALGYNALVVSWPEIARLAAELQTSSEQQTLGV